MNKNEEKTEKYCKFCESAMTLTDPDTMLCPYKGAVRASFSCGKFSYDPLKRIPPEPIPQKKPPVKLEYIEI